MPSAVKSEEIVNFVSQNSKFWVLLDDVSYLFKLVQREAFSSWVVRCIQNQQSGLVNLQDL